MFEELKAKYRFWRANKFIQHGTHYEFMLDMSDTKAMAVKFLKKYPGVIAEYTNIHMSSDNEMSFEFNIIANPNLHNTETKKFQNFANDVFRSIIHSSVEYAKEKNENGNIDSIQSDSERTVHEEVVAVSEERVPERKPRKKGVRRSKKLHSQVQQSAADSGSGNQP